MNGIVGFGLLPFAEHGIDLETPAAAEGLAALEGFQKNGFDGKEKAAQKAAL